MSAINIECQLAQGQIGRYLNGDRISPQAVKQLEEHIADCPDCKEVVAARKQAIMVMLGEGKPVRAVVEMSSRTVKESPRSSFLDAIKLWTDEKNAPGDVQPKLPDAPKSAIKTPFFSKSAMYGLGLAAILLVMSYFSRGALKVFGPSSATLLPDSSSTAVDTQPKQPAKPATQSTETTLARLSQPTKSPALGWPNPVANNTKPLPKTELTAQPFPEKKSTPPAPAKPKPKPKPATPTVAKPKRIPKAAAAHHKPAKRTHRRPVRRHTIAKRPGKIRLYDSQGNALN